MAERAVEGTEGMYVSWVSVAVQNVPNAVWYV